MFTPQQIEQISFSRATFGGYDMQAVDEFLEPLTEDYVTLYKENALLKSKMKVLVNKLEEYRNNESSIRDAIINAEKTCDMMVREAEAKCAKMLQDANSTAVENTKHSDSLIAAENARVEEAKRIATKKIEELQDQINSCLQALERIKTANKPEQTAVTPSVANGLFDYERVENSSVTNKPEDVADEISANLQALVGSADEPIPAAEPKHPSNDTTTSKFANLQFGKNYDPTHRN